MEEKPLHIGSVIRETMKEQGRSASWLAKQLHCTRENVYRIYAREWIQTDMLLRISLVLEVNFFLCYAEYLQNRL